MNASRTAAEFPARGRSDRFGRAACAALALLLIVFHFRTIASPPGTDAPIVDQVELTDYAVHGRLSLWEGILPAREKFRAEGFVGGLWNGYSGTQGWLLRRIGVGGCESKLGSMICGLAGLLLLAWLVGSLGLPWFYPLGLLLYGFTKPFFELTHSARPEGYVFLAAAINWFWFFRGKGRPASLAAGLAATYAIAFHPAMTLSLAPLTVMLLVTRRNKLFSDHRFYWWTIGALIGTLAAMRTIDAERAGHFFALHSGTGVQTPPILRWLWHPLTLARHALDFDLFVTRQGYAWHFLFCCALFSCALLVRGYGRLEKIRRSLLGATLLTLLSFALMQSSTHGVYYFVYLEPWLILSLTAGAEMLLRDEIEVSLAEQILFAAAHVAIFAAILKGFWMLALFSFGASLLARSSIPQKMRALILGAAGLALIAAVLFSGSLCWEIGSGATYLLRHRPGLLALLLGLPLLLMIPDRPGAAGERWGFVRFKWVFLAYCLVNSGALLASQLRHVAQTPSNCPCTLPGDLEARFLGLRREKRLVAPEQLWFYAPSLSFQAADAIWSKVVGHAPINMARTLADYAPSLVLWPLLDETALRNQAAGLKGRPYRFEWGAVWHTPSGDWQELRIARADRSN